MPWLWLVLLAAVAALLGGSSRLDAVQIAALRPLVALFMVPAIYYLKWDQLRQAKPLVLLFCLITLWMAIQLVPLPPSLWHTLPGREVVARLDGLAGLDEAWRPIAWIPSRGWNALGSLIVPVTALLLALSLRATPRMLLLIICGIGLLDALLGLLQVISGHSSPLFYYAVTNRGSPVGIFANENHSAVFSAIVMLAIARLGMTSRELKEVPWLRLVYPPAFLVVLLAVLVSGSRAGFATGIVALTATGLMIWFALAPSRRGRKQNKVQRWLAKHPRILILAFSTIVLTLLGTFFGLERAPGFENVFSQNAFEDLRWQIWPIVEGMIGSNWLFGIGFGSFEEYYHIYEPTDLLLPSYLNQAHNDWAQVMIEGGLPALVLLATLLGWIAVTLRYLVRNSNTPLADAIYWGATIAILCAASIVDYPLRTPTIQLVATWLLLALALERHELPAVRRASRGNE